MSKIISKLQLHAQVCLLTSTIPQHSTKSCLRTRTTSSYSTHISLCMQHAMSWSLLNILMVAAHAHLQSLLSAPPRPVSQAEKKIRRSVPLEEGSITSSLQSP